MRSVYKILVGRREERKLLWRPGYKWEDNTKMDLKEVGCENVDWIQLRAFENTIIIFKL
jgi:hypothetical protein